jgi:c-di-GMP-binding flagellar brake protein YcgR
MNCAEEHEPGMNRRRYQRYEIDTQLQVTLLSLEERGTLRGRSLNISEAGIAGVFVTVWDVGARRCAQSLRLPLRI